MNSDALDLAIRDWAARHQLPQTPIDYWLGLAVDDRSAMLELAQTLRLRTGQCLVVLELLDELHVRDQITIRGLLQQDSLWRIIHGGGSAPGKARALIEALRTRRFPRLKQTMERLTAMIAATDLPAGVRLVLPSNLGSDELRVELTVHNGDELRRLLDAVAVRGERLSEIADALGGTDEV